MLFLSLAGSLGTLDGELVLRRVPVGGVSRAVARLPVSTAGRYRAELPGPGVYHARLTVRGSSASGMAFERSVIFSVGVAGDGRAPEGLPEACR